MSENTIRLSEDQARRFCHDVYAQLDVSEEERYILIDLLVDTSLRGVDTHGVLLNAIYAQRIRSGQIRPGNRLRVDRRTPVSILADACQGIGQVTSVEGMRLAIDMGKTTGIGAVAIYNQSHNGAISCYARMAAVQGLIGIVFGNSTPRVTPYGGRSGLHGTNPVAYAVPAGDRPPVVCDFATAASGAAIRQAMEDRLPEIPEGLALSRDGHPTTDPTEAFNGWLLPRGGPMGYGLGLLADILVGALSGSRCGLDVPPVSDLNSPYDCGSFMLVIDPDAFAGDERFVERVGFLIDSAQTIAPMEGFDRVRVPGERGEEEKRRRRIEGIPIRRRSWDHQMAALEACELDITRWRHMG